MKESIILLEKFENFNEKEDLNELMLYEIKDYICESIKKDLKTKDKELKKDIIKELLIQCSKLFNLNSSNETQNKLKIKVNEYLVSNIFFLIINKKYKKILIEVFNENPIIPKDIIEKVYLYNNYIENKFYEYDGDYIPFNEKFFLNLIKKMTVNFEIEYNKEIPERSLIKTLMEHKDGYIIFEKLNEESKSYIKKISSEYKFHLEKEESLFTEKVIEYISNLVFVFIGVFLIPLVKMEVLDSKLTKKMSKFEIKGVDYPKCLLLKKIEVNDLKHLMKFKFENPEVFDENGVLIDLDLFEINFKI